MVPLKVDYKNFEQHPELDSIIQDQVEKLQKYFDRITSCHVVLSKPHNRHVNGHVYHVHIDIHIPGNIIAITREPERDERHDDAGLAIRDAFKIAKRKLQDYGERLRHKVKNHNKPA